MRNELPLMKLLKIVGRYKEFNSVLELHKAIYVMQSEKGVKLGYSFVNYSFGPYSKDLENDLNLLAQTGLIAMEGNGKDVRVKLSSKGATLLHSLEN
ncbi:MAG: hypothetical protein QXM76_01115, partial [Zestosphaera sp.]